MKKILVLLLLFPAISSYSQKWLKNYDSADEFSCGLSKVKKDGKTGYVNTNGVEIIKLQYDDGLTFSEGYTAVKSGTKWMYLDSTGKAITEQIFDDAINFSHGLAPAEKNNRYGYINTAGEVVIPFQFTNARCFSEDLCPVSNGKGFWGYIDKKANWVINPVYDFTDSFENGEARVMKDSKVFYIDRRNKVLHE
jgi:hypothetical protein